MKTLKTWFTSRTNWFGLAVLVMGALSQWLATAPVPTEWQPLVTMATGGIVLLLRKMTKGPIGTGPLAGTSE